MKKALLIFVMGALLSMSASAQWFDFKNNVHRYEIGVNLGMAGTNTAFHDFGFGASLSAWGVYLDVISAGPMYKYDNRVASMNDPASVRFLPDSTTTTVNLGYQVPVLPWLRVMPLVGCNICTSGHTDMATHSAQVSGNDEYVSVELYHDYNREYRWAYFNFGGGLVISPLKWLSVYGVYTTHAFYGGISINLGGVYGLWGE